MLKQTPDDPKLRRSVATSRLKIGDATDPKDPAATENVRRAIEILETLAAKDANNQRAYRDVGFGYYQLGKVQAAAGDMTGALASRRKAYAIREKVSERDPKNVQARFDLAVAHGDLAEALSATGDTAEALNHARRTFSILDNLSAADPTNAVYERNAGLNYEKLGQIYARMGADTRIPVAQRVKNWSEARTWYGKALELFSTLRDRGTLMPADVGEPQIFAVKVRECDEALSRLK